MSYSILVRRLHGSQGIDEKVGFQNPNNRCQVSFVCCWFMHCILRCFCYFRECINKVCEAAGLKTVDKKRRIDKQVQRAIAELPKMDYAGTNVNLNISSSSLTLTSLDNDKIIASHDMPRISFASGGDCVSNYTKSVFP